jgi:hypothetical protein
MGCNFAFSHAGFHNKGDSGTDFRCKVGNISLKTVAGRWQRFGDESFASDDFDLGGEIPVSGQHMVAFNDISFVESCPSFE